MKTDRLFRKFRVLGVLLVLLVTGTGASCQYSKEENYWKNLSGTEKRQAINLELERVWEDIFLPAPQPERYAHVTAETLEHSMRLGATGLSLCKNITDGFNTGMILLVISSAVKPMITFCVKQALHSRWRWSMK